MAEPQKKVDITARVIDLGDRVIQLTHVVSAGRTAVYPFRPAGIALFLFGLAAIGSEFALRGGGAMALSSGGSLSLWLGFGCLGVGIFLFLFARRLFIIRTADGARTVLPTESDEAGDDLLQRIRVAMEAAGGPRPALTAPATALPAADPVPAIAARSQTPISLPQASAPMLRSPPSGEVPQTMPAMRRGEPYANGHASRGAYGGNIDTGSKGAGGTDPRTGPRQAPAQMSPSGGMPSLETAPPGDWRSAAAPTGFGPLDPGPGTIGPGTVGREPMGLPSAVAATGLRDDAHTDLLALIEHVRRADVQHKDALLDLLRVVDDYYRGQTNRDEAVAHWRSFADYVAQYLADVDGLSFHTDRFGRHLTPR
jgi:hypothetical protein